MVAALEQTRRNDVAIVFPEIVAYGGEERLALALSEAMYRKGIAHHLVCYRDLVGLQRFAEWPLHVEQLRPQENASNKSRALASYLARLHSAGAPLPILYGIQAATHAGMAVRTPYHLRIADTPRFLTGYDAVHGPKDWLRRFFRDRATRKGFAQADAVITNTELLKNDIRTLYGRTAEVVYPGGLPARGDYSGPRPFPLRLLSVSRLQSSKRIDWMLRTLAAQTGEWRLDIAGDGPEREPLQAIAAQLAITSRVEFHGFTNAAEIEDLYRRAHIFLVPAWQGYGLPAIEALRRRVPVVLNVESGVSEILQNTDWVAIGGPSEASWSSAVKVMIDRVTSGIPLPPAPALPTDIEFAERIIAITGWSKSQD